jgi:ABC-type transport system involved in cytochrome bd biosynthesis fused ATPase/permease subunit
LKPSPPRLLPRQQQLQLLRALAQEAGWRHLALLSLLSATSSLLDIAGLGLAVSLLLGGGRQTAAPLPLLSGLPLSASLGLLVALILLRGLIQARVDISRERLRSGFTDRLRQQLLHRVFAASAAQLERIGRGDLLALLMVDINRTALGLDQAVRMGQALLAMAIYLGSVLVVGRAAAWPLLLALVATATAALLQRSGSWSLGRIQSRLNAALQRTVGDGLHGLKAVRAAAAEPWLLERFAKETAEGRWLLRERVRRRASYNAWRDTLVVAIAGLWMVLQSERLTAEVLTTTLVLAYRAGASLSGVVQARRLCLGNLPGYEALRNRRQQLQAQEAHPHGTALPQAATKALNSTPWSQLVWRSNSGQAPHPATVTLGAQRLVAITGPSGSGKTSCLDRLCGLLEEDTSDWSISCGTDHWRCTGLTGAQQLHQWVAYAPQNAVLFEASLRDNLLLGGQAAPGSIEAWLQRLGLTHLLERKGDLDAPLALAQDPFSGGEIHRLGLLRAWLRERPVEVLDEPTAFLDATAAAQVREVIHERAQQRLVLVSSHDPDLLAQADEVIVLG